MKEISVSNNYGRMFLIYGPTGEGKSASSIATLPQPIQVIQTEPRNPLTALVALGKVVAPDWLHPKDGEIGIKFSVPESFEDLIEFLDGEAKKESHEYKSILFDSASYWMNVKLSQDIEDQTYDAGIFKDAKRTERKLVDMTRKDQAAFGSLSSLMKRVMKLLGTISQQGVVVVVIALVSESPKWNRALAACPAFIGADFPTNAPSYFDAIGLVEGRTNDAGEKVYPPIVSFDGDGSYVSKWTGKRDRKPIGPLDFAKILKL